MRWKHDHDSACKPQRKSNGLEYRPFVVNSQNSAPIQYGQASRSESLAQRSDFSSLARKIRSLRERFATGRLSILDWCRILRVHHEWTIFQAIRFALWLAR